MTRKILFLFAVLLITAGLFLFVKVLDSFKTPGKGALQINTNIKGKVFLNDKEIGTAPLCKCTENDTLQAGIYDLRIEPEDISLPAFNTKISINGGVLTAVDRTFLPGAYASASILTLEKISSEKPEILITSLPDQATITIDSAAKGITPFKSTDISPSEHELKISKSGFQEKTLRIQIRDKHRLIIEVYLGSEGADDASKKLDENNTTDQTATESAEIIQTNENKTATILSTPNGFLRVRSGAGTDFDEISRVNTGEKYEVTDEENTWIEIKIDDNTTGWISSQFAEIN